LCGVFVFGLCAQVTPARVDALADTLPPATIVVDEGGPVAIAGELSYTDPFFTIGTAAPMVILEDQAGFVDRDEGYILPVASQTLGQITSDFYTSPFSYTLSLPIEPQAALRDVDQDGGDDAGVMIFAVAYWTNVFGDPFLEERDLFGGGWPTAYASTRVSNDAPSSREIVGGTLLVYAPDDEQGFPTGFGVDGLLFTEDDPIARLPQGYTLVRMDVDAGAESFTFDRSRYPAVQLVESKKRVLEDYSTLAYGAAAVIFCVSLALGCTLEASDLRAVWRRQKRGVAVGWASQFGFMPLFACVCGQSVGLMIAFALHFFPSFSPVDVGGAA